MRSQHESKLSDERLMHVPKMHYLRGVVREGQEDISLGENNGVSGLLSRSSPAVISRSRVAVGLRNQHRYVLPEAFLIPIRDVMSQVQRLLNLTATADVVR